MSYAHCKTERACASEYARDMRSIGAIVSRLNRQGRRREVAAWMRQSDRRTEDFQARMNEIRGITFPSVTTTPTGGLPAGDKD